MVLWYYVLASLVVLVTILLEGTFVGYAVSQGLRLSGLMKHSTISISRLQPWAISDVHMKITRPTGLCIELRIGSIALRPTKAVAREFSGVPDLPSWAGTDVLEFFAQPKYAFKPLMGMLGRVWRGLLQFVACEMRDVKAKLSHPDTNVKVIMDGRIEIDGAASDKHEQSQVVLQGVSIIIKGTIDCGVQVDDISLMESTLSWTMMANVSPARFRDSQIVFELEMFRCKRPFSIGLLNIAVRSLLSVGTKEERQLSTSPTGEQETSFSQRMPHRATTQEIAASVRRIIEKLPVLVSIKIKDVVLPCVLEVDALSFTVTPRIGSISLQCHRSQTDSRQSADESHYDAKLRMTLRNLSLTIVEEGETSLGLQEIDCYVVVKTESVETAAPLTVIAGMEVRKPRLSVYLEQVPDLRRALQNLTLPDGEINRKRDLRKLSFGSQMYHRMGESERLAAERVRRRIKFRISAAVYDTEVVASYVDTRQRKSYDFNLQIAQLSSQLSTLDLKERILVPCNWSTELSKILVYIKTPLRQDKVHPMAKDWATLHPTLLVNDVNVKLQFIAHSPRPSQMECVICCVGSVQAFGDIAQLGIIETLKSISILLQEPYTIATAGESDANEPSTAADEVEQSLRGSTRNVRVSVTLDRFEITVSLVHIAAFCCLVSKGASLEWSSPYLNVSWSPMAVSRRYQKEELHKRAVLAEGTAKLYRDEEGIVVNVDVEDVGAAITVGDLLLMIAFADAIRAEGKRPKLSRFKRGRAFSYGTASNESLNRMISAGSDSSNLGSPAIKVSTVQASVRSVSFKYLSHHNRKIEVCLDEIVSNAKTSNATLDIQLNSMNILSNNNNLLHAAWLRCEIPFQNRPINEERLAGLAMDNMANHGQSAEEDMQNPVYVTSDPLVKKKAPRVILIDAEMLEITIPHEYPLKYEIESISGGWKMVKALINDKETSHPEPHRRFSALLTHFRIKRTRVVMEDDSFEVRLNLNYQLMREEQLQQQERQYWIESMLSAGGFAIDNEKVWAELQKLCSAVYIQRARAMHAQFENSEGPQTGESEDEQPSQDLAPLISLRIDDLSLAVGSHRNMRTDEDILTEMQRIDEEPLPYGIRMQTLLACNVSLKAARVSAQIRDYARPLILGRHVTVSSPLVIAERSADKRSMYNVPVEDQGLSFTIHKTTTTVKIYVDPVVDAKELKITHGPCYEHGLAEVSRCADLFTFPSIDDSPLLPFWDKLRLMIRGSTQIYANDLRVILTLDRIPHEKNRALELKAKHARVDANGNMVIETELLEALMRDPSQYNRSKILSIPRARLNMIFQWTIETNVVHHMDVIPVNPAFRQNFSSWISRQNNRSGDVVDSFEGFRTDRLDLVFELSSAKPQNVTVEELEKEDWPTGTVYGQTLTFISDLVKAYSNPRHPIREGKIFDAVPKKRKSLGDHIRSITTEVDFRPVCVYMWETRDHLAGAKLTCNRGSTTVVNRQVNLPSLGTESGRRVRQGGRWVTSSVNMATESIEIHTIARDPDHTSQLLMSSAVVYQSAIYKSRPRAPKDSNSLEPAHFLHQVKGTTVWMTWSVFNSTIVFRLWDKFISLPALQQFLKADAVQDMIKATLDHHTGNSFSDVRQGLEINVGQGERVVAYDQAKRRLNIYLDEYDNLDVSSHHLNVTVDTMQLKVMSEEDNDCVIVTSPKLTLYEVHEDLREVGEFILVRKVLIGDVENLQAFMPIESMVDKIEHLWMPDALVRGVSQKEFDLISSFCQRIIRECRLTFSYRYHSQVLKEQAVLDRGLRGSILDLSATSGGTKNSFNMIDDGNLEQQRAQDSTVGQVLSLLIHGMDIECDRRQFYTVIDAIRYTLLESHSFRHTVTSELETMNLMSSFETADDLYERIKLLQMELKGLRKQRQAVRFQSYILQIEERHNRKMTIGDEEPDAGADTGEGAVLLQLDNDLEDKIFIKLLQLELILRLYGDVVSPTSDRQISETEGVLKRTEICLENATWCLLNNTDKKDGGFANISLGAFSYLQTNNRDNSVTSLYECYDLNAFNIMKNAKLLKVLAPKAKGNRRDETMARVYMRNCPPVGGIPVIMHFEVNIVPLDVAVTYHLYQEVYRYFFVESVDEAGKSANKGKGHHHHGYSYGHQHPSVPTQSSPSRSRYHARSASQSNLVHSTLSYTQSQGASSEKASVSPPLQGTDTDLNDSSSETASRGFLARTYSEISDDAPLGFDGPTLPQMMLHRSTDSGGTGADGGMGTLGGSGGLGPVDANYLTGALEPTIQNVAPSSEPRLRARPRVIQETIAEHGVSHPRSTSDTAAELSLRGVHKDRGHRDGGAKKATDADTVSTHSQASAGTSGSTNQAQGSGGLRKPHFAHRRGKSLAAVAAGRKAPPSSSADGLIGGSSNGGSAIVNFSGGTGPDSDTRSVTSSAQAAGQLNADSTSQVSAEKRSHLGLPIPSGTGINASSYSEELGRMRTTAALVKSFVYIKITDIRMGLSYRGTKERNIEDFDDLELTTPVIEYHDHVWSWKQFADQFMRDGIKAVLAARAAQAFNPFRKKEEQSSRIGDAEENESTANGGDASSGGGRGNGHPPLADEGIIHGGDLIAGSVLMREFSGGLSGHSNNVGAAADHDSLLTPRSAAQTTGMGSTESVSGTEKSGLGHQRSNPSGLHLLGMASGENVSALQRTSERDQRIAQLLGLGRDGGPNTEAEERAVRKGQQLLSDLAKLQRNRM
eukprot:Clim_evm16s200 gene=Clim_evmTU16s200